jgi:hypothetical protein
LESPKQQLQVKVAFKLLTEKKFNLDAKQFLNDVMGKCEVCDKPATTIVRDYLLGDGSESERLEWTGMVKPGPVHQFCDEHKRESRTVQTLEE